MNCKTILMTLNGNLALLGVNIDVLESEVIYYGYGNQYRCKAYQKKRIKKL